MKERGHCTSGVCPETSEKGEIVQLYVDHNHPLLQLKRALPWERLFEVMSRHWREAGKNIDGRPGLSWDVSLYVPLLVLMLVKRLNSRDMEDYLKGYRWLRRHTCDQEQGHPESLCYPSRQTVGRGDRFVIGASCPFERLVPGARDHIIGDRHRPDPVWETAYPSLLPRRRSSTHHCT